MYLYDGSYLNDVGGKRDEKLILPINSSLSVTLNQDEVCCELVVASVL